MFLAVIYASAPRLMLLSAAAWVSKIPVSRSAGWGRPNGTRGPLGGARSNEPFWMVIGTSGVTGSRSPKRY